jgi:type III secretion protein T
MGPGDLLWNFIFITARFFGAMTICPIFSEERFPRTLRMLLAMLFALIIYPRFAAPGATPYLVFRIFLLCKEIMFGVIIGYLFSFPIWVIENVGNLIDIQRGEQFGAQVSQLTKNPSSSISKLLSNGFVTYIVSIGALLYFFRFVALSFMVIAPTQLIIHYNSYCEKIIQTYCNYFFWAVVLALPAIFAMYLLELVIGLFSSFVPQLNVTIISMPLKSVMALLVLSLYMGTLYHFVIAKFINEELFNIFKI